MTNSIIEIFFTFAVFVLFFVYLFGFHIFSKVSFSIEEKKVVFHLNLFRRFKFLRREIFFSNVLNVREFDLTKDRYSSDFFRVFFSKDTICFETKALFFKKKVIAIEEPKDFLIKITIALDKYRRTKDKS